MESKKEYIMNELVSIIIPTYRRKKGLIKAISSAVKQTYSNIEIIIIDDNDDDNYSKIIKKIINNFKDERIKYFKNNSNLGSALSRNKGITLSKGNYVAFLDDDDEYLENSIEKKLKKIVNDDTNVAMVYGWVRSVDEQGKVLNLYRYKFKGHCLYNGLYDCIAATSQWLCRKEALIKVGGFSKIPSQEDWYLIIKLLEKGYKIDYVPEILNIYHEHSGLRMSTGGIKNLQGLIEVRNIARKNYIHLKKRERKNIEIHLSSIILYLSLKNEMWSKGLIESRNLMKYSKIEVLKKWTGLIIRKYILRLSSNK